MRQAAHTLVFDVDGVVLDFYGGAKRVLEDMLQRPMVVVDPRPATKHRYGLTDDEYHGMREVMRTHAHGWKNLPVLPGAVESLLQLQAHGHRAMFLSSCGQSLYDPRRENLDRLGLGNCELICVEDKDKNAKGVVLDKIRPLVFVDDHMKMLAQATSVKHRVWIDHGCSLEIDPATQRPYLEDHAVERVSSIRSWITHWLHVTLEQEAPVPQRRRGLRLA